MSLHRRATAFIFARGGSKGIPRKNLALVGGRSLLALAIEAAQRCPEVADVIVSTDDEEIASVARKCGAKIPFIRPSELAGDRASEWLAWQHAAQFFRDRGDDIGAFLSVPATAPLRLSEDLSAALDTFWSTEADFVFTVTPAHRNPYFNMMRIDPDGTARLFLENDSDRPVRRQDAPEAFDITTVAYVANPEFVLRAKGPFEGVTRAWIVPAERSLDVDTPLDLEIANFLYSRRQGL
jgi:N-acylneuraminate cytidylyltransferase